MTPLYDKARPYLAHDQFRLALLALLAGIVTGGAVIGFREAIQGAQWLGYGFGGEEILDDVKALAWWKLLLVPTIGGLIIGLFVHYFLPFARPQGVAEVIEANTIQSGRMGLLTGLKTALVSAASLGVGASVGREGPAVHLGATLGATIARYLGLRPSMMRTLLGCGVASAVAASFNAPVAGAIFAHEIILGHYAIQTFAPVVIASAAGTFVSRVYFGDVTAFAIPQHEITSFLEFPAFIGLGVVAAIAAMILMHGVMKTRDGFISSPLPRWSWPAVAGFFVGALALVYPEVLGIGYDITISALRGEVAFGLLAALVLAKIVATSLSLGAGFGGGIFSPSLVVGALVGGTYGIIVTSLVPELSSGSPAYTVVGMGAVAAAVLGAPISTILIALELTLDWPLTVAMMISVVISTLIIQRLMGVSFFTWQLKRRGVDLKAGPHAVSLRSQSVRDYMRQRFHKFRPGTTLGKVWTRMVKTRDDRIFIMDKDGKLYGAVTIASLTRGWLSATFLKRKITAGDVADADLRILQAKDSLRTAQAMFEEGGNASLPVVDGMRSRKLVGILYERDIVDILEEEQAKAQEEVDKKAEETAKESV